MKIEKSYPQFYGGIYPQFDLAKTARNPHFLIDTIELAAQNGHYVNLTGKGVKNEGIKAGSFSGRNVGRN